MTASGITARGPLPAVPARRRPLPWPLLGTSAAVAAVLLTPLAFLLIEAGGTGAGTIVHLIWRPLTAGLLWNTIRLTVVVTALCAVIGTLTAWCVECTDLPGRRIWAVLVVVPFAIPDFVVSFGWASISSWVQGFQGAVLVMTLAVYPLVHLPVAASLRSADPGHEDVARSLGVGRVRTFLRVTVGQARGAILGGCVLVALVILAEYGAFEILGYQTFTTEIFTEFQVSFNVPTACALSLVLILLSFVVLGAEAPARGRGRAQRTGPLAQRARRHPPRPRDPCGRGRDCWRWSVSRWGSRSAPPSTGCSPAAPQPHRGLILDAGLAHRPLQRLRRGPGHRCGAAGGPAGGPPRRSRRPAARAENLHGAGHARAGDRPGPQLLLRALRGRVRLPDSLLLVAAYAIFFFPLALVGVRASVAHAPVASRRSAVRSGAGASGGLRRVTLPSSPRACPPPSASSSSPAPPS